MRKWRIRIPQIPQQGQVWYNTVTTSSIQTGDRDYCHLCLAWLWRSSSLFLLWLAKLLQFSQLFTTQMMHLWNDFQQKFKTSLASNLDEAQKFWVVTIWASDGIEFIPLVFINEATCIGKVSQWAWVKLNKPFFMCRETGILKRICTQQTRRSNTTLEGQLGTRAVDLTIRTQISLLWQEWSDSL